MAVRGFYCQLCREFFGDPICAEEHVTSQAHNEKYKQRMYENPLYEQRRNLDRQAGMAMTSETKHCEQKHSKRGKEEERLAKQKEEEEATTMTKSQSVREEEKRSAYGREEEDGKSKHSRKEEKEDKYKYRKKEEEEDRPKYGRREEEEERPKYGPREEEQERPRYSRREEEEARFKYAKREREEEEELRFKYGRKEREEEDSKFKYSKKEENEGRSKYSRRAEEDISRGKHSRQQEEDQRSRSARDEDERVSHRADDRRSSRSTDKRSRYSQEEPDRKPKHGKWEEEDNELKPKWTKEEPPQKKERSYRNRQEKGGKKGEGTKEEKPEVPDKPVELPKVLCGPSPAMLAKLRKKNEEANKGGTFGKFTWKKPQKTQLEKEAERMAAQFIREDEEAAKAAEQATMVKEPLAIEGVEGDDAFARSLAAAKTIAIKLAGKTALPTPTPWQPLGLSPSPMVLRKSAANNTSPVNPALAMKPVSVTPVKAQPPAPTQEEKKDAMLSADVISMAFGGQEVQLKVPEILSPNSSSDPVASSVSSEAGPSAPVANQSKLAKAETVPAPQSVCVMSMEADVAVPGVPESEQTHAVVVRPPPMVHKPSTTKAPPRSAKPKSSLAAAKAQDLFDIFYSGVTPTSTTTHSTVPKPAAQEQPKAGPKEDKKEQVPEHKDQSVPLETEKCSPEVVMEPAQLETDRQRQQNLFYPPLLSSPLFSSSHSPSGPPSPPPPLSPLFYSLCLSEELGSKYPTWVKQLSTLF